MLPFDLPSGLLAQGRLGPRWQEWLDRLPALTQDVVADWELSYDGAPLHGYCSLVVPVRTAGVEALLKVTFDGDDESLHEGLALQHLHGNGSVRLLRADPRRRALLLERLSLRDLTGLWDVEACEVVAGLYARFHIPALPQLRPLTAYLREWNDGLRALGRAAPMPRRLVEQAVALADDLLADPTSTGTMIHGDLHYENVLAAEREPWLVIDPKPMSGDPHYEIAPLLWNRWEEAVDSGNVREVVRRRFHTTVDAAGFDEDRARDWVIVRALHNAFWTIDDARARERPVDGEERDWITTMVTVAKAVQD